MDISNQGPTDTIRELSPMDIQLCSQGETSEDSESEMNAHLSQDVQHTPISSQVVPMNELGLSSQCSSSCATPCRGTPIATRKTRKRKGYRATKDRKRDAIKKRRTDDSEFRDKENETRLANVNNDREDPETRAKYNSDMLKRMTDKLKDPAERAKYNERQLKLVTDKRIDSKEKMRHNLAELDRYRTMRGALKSVILKYLSEIAEGPTFVCSCCGCLHFRKTVVILKREKLVSTNVCKHDFVKQVTYSI